MTTIDIELDELEYIVKSCNQTLTTIKKFRGIKRIMKSADKEELDRIEIMVEKLRNKLMDTLPGDLIV